MTAKLDQVIAQLRTLPEGQQDHYAAVLEDELADDMRWQELLARPESEAFLDQLADEALEDHRAGRTRPLEDIL